MKNKKSLIYIIIAVLVIALCIVYAISSDNKQENANNNNVTDNIAEETQKAEQVIECIKQLETTNTVEEINTITGLEGTKSEYSDEYTWKFSNKNYIMLKYAGDSPILQATINKEIIKNNEVKLPLSSELREMLNNGSFTYEELVSKLGGIEGTLSGKTSGSVSYIWVDKHDQTLRATFNNESGKCTIASFQ